jgi:tetratricopeptide (TPR) repeat protein
MARLRLVAESLERLSRRMTTPESQLLAPRFARETEMVVRQYVDQNPGQDIVMVTFLIRQGQLNEALDTLERIWEKNHPVSIAFALVALQNSENVSQEQLKRGEGILYAALKKFDRAPALLLVMAHLSTGREKYDQAEAYYREVLSKDPTNAVAMNNLAMLLALQRTKLDEALKMVNRAIEISGPIGSMLDSRAVVYMALRQPDKAVADMVEAVADSGVPIRLFHLAQAYEQAGQRAKATDAFNKAQKSGLKPHDLHPLERIAYQQLLELLK